jgi:hypothetical protein
MSAGKGDRPRPVDKSKYDNNYKKIFGRKEKPIIDPKTGKAFPQGYQGYQGCEGCLKKIGAKKLKKGLTKNK